MTALLVFAIGGLLMLTRIRIQQWQNNPQVFLLNDSADAKWIRAYHSFNLGVQNYQWQRETWFRYRFELSEPVERAALSIQAFRRCKVWVDAESELNQPLFSTSSDFNTWKRRYEIPLPPRLSRGHHELLILVSNRAAHPCLLASSHELGIHSGKAWEVKEGLRDWEPAVLASEPVTNVAVKVKEAGYTNVFTSFLRIWPWLTVVCGISCIWTWWHSSSPAEVNANPQWDLSPSRLRWILLIAWLAMAMNNLWRVSAEIGFDTTDHLDYVKYILEHRSIPLASDGWQMFQSPLQYLLAAPFYSLFARTFDSQSCLKLLRFLPLLSGMLQIEIAYRAARKVFPGQADLQSIATTVGGMMPMSIYMSQSFCNEPLAGCLTSLVILMCLSLTSEPGQKRGFLFFLTLGVVWGLALLTKVTPLILAPIIFAAIIFEGCSYYRSLNRSMSAMVVTFSACFVTAGWYYIRNLIYLGTPFVGGWDPARGILWWQDPSYRTWSQLTSFGAVLVQPIYSGVDSFWDAIYSTMWLDGYLSATLNPASQIPWNFHWMEVGTWLALLPQACILMSVAMLSNRQQSVARSSLLFAWSAVGIYLAAILDLYLQIPIYSAAKASYMLGLLPCFGILAAAGSRVLLQNRWLRMIYFAILTCWVTAVYVAYFCIK